jgi:hypothetical protein
MTAIIDTPVYENPADGERMIAERVRHFQRKYEMPEALGRQPRFLISEGISKLAAEHNLRVRIHRPTFP